MRQAGRKSQKTTHQEQLANLRRIEGQIRGIQKMIEGERYCMDILIQLHAIIGAIENVENKILDKHLQGCVAQAFRQGQGADRARKIKEILDLINKFRK